MTMACDEHDMYVNPVGKKNFFVTSTSGPSFLPSAHRPTICIYIFFFNMQHFHFMLSLLLVAVLATDDLFTDSPDNNAYNPPLLGPSLDQSSPLDLATPGLVDGDIFSSSDPSVGEPGLLDEGGVNSEWLASAPTDECSSPTFRFRRRNTMCTTGDNKPYFQDFRERAAQSAQELYMFDVKNCLGVLPYFVCSSNDPVYTVYWPGILSWVLYQSTRGTFLFLVLGMKAKKKKGIQLTRQHMKCFLSGGCE